jgi:predicted nucleic acid-binding protein
VKLLDTSVCADHLLARPEAVALLDGLLADGEDLASSELVRFELLAGTRPAEQAALDAFQAALVWSLVYLEEACLRHSLRCDIQIVVWLWYWQMQSAKRRQHHPRRSWKQQTLCQIGSHCSLHG